MLIGSERVPVQKIEQLIPITNCCLKTAIKFQPILNSYLTNKVKNFKAGCIAKDLKNWREITSDIEVLNSVSGLTIDFENKPDVSYKPNKFANKEFATVASELKSYWQRGSSKIIP